MIQKIMPSNITHRRSCSTAERAMSAGGPNAIPPSQQSNRPASHLVRIDRERGGDFYFLRWVNIV